jgi:hypothetical protein
MSSWRALMGLLVVASGCAGLVGADFDGLPRGDAGTSAVDGGADASLDADEDGSSEVDAGADADVSDADAATPETNGVDVDAAETDGVGADSSEGGVPRGSIIVTPTYGLVTTEWGEGAAFSIRLGTKPVSNVLIAISSENDPRALGEVSLSELVTFTPTTWDVPHRVLFWGLDDEFKDGDQTFVIRTEPAQSDDPAYAGVDPSDVEVTNVDDETAGFTIHTRRKLWNDNLDSKLTVNEAGARDWFTIRLNAPPKADVTVDLVSGALSRATVSPASVTFTPTDWMYPQEVVVRGVDDGSVGGSDGTTIVTMPAKSSDPSYDGLDPPDLPVTTLSNDMPGVSIVAGSGSERTLLQPASGETFWTEENGETWPFAIVLDFPPTADVTIGLSSSDTKEGLVAPTTVTFTPVNWNVPQEITVTGVDDLLSDGDQPYTILIGKAASADKSYDGLDVVDVPMMNYDDEPPGF